MRQPTLKDFTRLLTVAKEHGLSVRNVEDIAIVEMGKGLGEFTVEELEAFVFRISGVDRVLLPKPGPARPAPVSSIQFEVLSQTSPHLYAGETISVDMRKDFEFWTYYPELDLLVWSCVQNFKLYVERFERPKP